MPQENPYAHSFDNTTQTSAMAIVSLVFGVLSVPTMCLCFLSIPFSLVAIVTGHSARAIVCNSGGAYRGAGEALAGLILGYGTFVVVAGSLAFLSLSTTIAPPVPAPGGSGPSVSKGQVLLEQAEATLLSATNQTTSGVTTSEHNATDLAKHYIETLHIVDKTHFAETNPDVEPELRNYRAFVQLNEDSVAFLLFVPEYVRFTEAAKETLSESCWLIAQRSVDDLLRAGLPLAVAIYSEEGCRQMMIGVTERDGPADAGLLEAHAEAGKLAEFFKLPDRPEVNPVAEAAEFESQIDNKALPGHLVLPAEVD